MMNKVSLLIFASFLSGCSFLGQDELLPLYTLKSGNIEPRPVLSDSLAVDMPLSEASLDTQRIALTPSAYERDYLADGQWPERLPKIMQEVLLESLSERWGGASVSRVTAGLQVKYLLQTEIQDFSVYQLNAGQPEVHLKVAFKLVDLRARKVLAGQVFCIKETACASSMGAIVEAFNNGVHHLLAQAMPWMESGFLKESALNTGNDKLGR
jgi:cholesterol transport system auxiliary component